MKWYACLFFIFFSNLSFSQQSKSPFAVDWVQSLYPVTPQELAKKLTASHSTELEKSHNVLKSLA